MWDISVRNDIIGTFYYGYMVLQIPGGRVAELYGGKRVRGSPLYHFIGYLLKLIFCCRALQRQAGFNATLSLFLIFLFKYFCGG